MRNVLIVLSLLLAFPSVSDARRADLRGSVTSQKRQNREADRADLSRLRDLSQLKRFVGLGLLVPVSDRAAYVLGPYLGHLDRCNASWYRHTRPWTLRFLDRELGAGHRATGHRFKITSLVRTEHYQRKLVRSGANAISGRKWWMRSSHLTGATIDISYKDMPKDAQRWLERRLLALERRGLIEATKERRSYCYHVMVFPKYGKRR